MKPLEVWTCQRAENLKKKSSKIPKNSYAAKMVSAARRQIIGGGGAPINKSRRRRRSQIVGGGGAARPAHSSTPTPNDSIITNHRDIIWYYRAGAIPTYRLSGRLCINLYIFKYGHLIMLLGGFNCISKIAQLGSSFRPML